MLYFEEFFQKWTIVVLSEHLKSRQVTKNLQKRGRKTDHDLLH